MSELQATLEDLHLDEYLSRLVEHGFDTWDGLTRITETEMATLGIKLGHRRRLQREIARRLGHPANEPLFTLPAATPPPREQCGRVDGITSLQRLKRRHRQRPSRHALAPTRPDTGFIKCPVHDGVPEPQKTVPSTTGHAVTPSQGCDRLDSGEMFG